jgi:fatty acid desaturase
VDAALSLCRQELRSVEWPTVTLAAIIYGGWGALTLCHEALPWWLLAPLGAWLVAWHSSLQHELLHGHPTRWPAVNAAIGFLPLALWLPFGRYCETHLKHHRDEHLTDPLEDPESNYVTPEQWREMSVLARAFRRVNATLLGRLAFGPARMIGRFLLEEARSAIRDRRRRRMLAAHALGAALVGWWLVAICRIEAWFYLAAIVYPAASLMLIRSFAEHRATQRIGERTAIVENARVLGLLFLFNNLHAAHHERPGLPWYELPRWYRANRQRLVAANGGLVYDGYLDVARRFLLRPQDALIHPGARLAPLPADG